MEPLVSVPRPAVRLALRRRTIATLVAKQANDREFEVPRGELLRITGSRRG
jgi:hypothetical protein